MKTIPLETIERSMAAFDWASETQMTQFVQRLNERQPALLDYLFTLEPDFDFQTGQLAAGSSGKFFFTGLAVLKIMLDQSPNHPTVTMEQIEAAEERNTAMLGRMDEGAEMEFNDFVVDMMENFNQPHLFTLALQMIMAEVQDADEIDDDMAMALLNIKTLIDCVDAA